MGMVMKITKSTGNKKPLGSFTAEAVQLEGAVLWNIIVRSWHQSNPASSTRLSHLQDYKNINRFYYILIFILKKNQDIESLLNENLVHRLMQSAKVAEN